MQFSTLASGSSGNSFYIEEDKKGILIDAGISCKQIEQRLELLGISIENIKALFISHEHTDHVRGADVLSRKYSIPIYLNKKTFESCSHIFSNQELIRTKPSNFECDIGKLSIKSFSKSHDANDPVSYTIKSKNKRISIITDAGYCCSNIINNIKKADALMLESNHDTQMLENGKYPIYLKRRIQSDLGHLSNYDSALNVLEHAPKKLKNISLSHLSLNNNTPDLAMKTFTSLLSERKDLNPDINLTFREKPTRLFKI
ncbi:MAG: MBL fold metallo-hydrolase [Nanoarchaeota archaeon]|nr:MBL fold metallo-hydrolase [Nanoarchaeota archaeon]